MKTFNLHKTKMASYILPIILGFFVVSCGSYNNSSYYDNDGIYSGSVSYDSGSAYYEQENAEAGSYFTQFQDYDLVEEEPVGIFTDIDSYYGDDSYSSGYSGWGNQTSDVTVNVYGGYGYSGWYDSYWGWRNPYLGIGWGWSSWHNPYWGWNSWHYPYYGGYYYPYYGGYYHRNYAYNNGPRNVYQSDYGYRSRAGNTNVTRSRATAAGQGRAYEVRGRSEAVNNPTRSNSRFTTDQSRSNVGTSRSVNSGRNSTINNNRNTTRNNSTINNSRTVNPTRNNQTINNNRNSTINNNNRTINNSRNSNINNNRNNTINSNRSTSPTINRSSGNMGGSRSSGTGGGSRSTSGGRR